MVSAARSPAEPITQLVQWVDDLKWQAMSWLLTYWPSEFSQVRGQYRRTSFAEGFKANELLFQFLFSIGAHGAHIF